MSTSKESSMVSLRGRKLIPNIYLGHLFVSLKVNLTKQMRGKSNSKTYLRKKEKCRFEKIRRDGKSSYESIEMD